ncbi:MAG: P-loop NTPase [Candidatus Marinamargulisbacteria bacterium]
MDKIKIINHALGTIYHSKQQCYLNNPCVLKDITITDNDVRCVFFEPAGSRIIHDLKSDIDAAIFAVSWVASVEISLHVMGQKTSKINPGLDHVTHIIAVSSCKGGVGKSTVSLNLASTLSMHGAQVGLFDADIHGPSLPTLVQPTEIATTLDDDLLPPFLNNGIKLMSYGYIQEQTDQPAILRGPIASNLLKQLLFKTDWGHLDYLIIDCPPGTGDILLTITQDIQLSGAIIVTSPHSLAYADVQKGIEMFRKVSVPILSLIENMSYFTCDHCAEKHTIYGSGKLQSFVKKNHIPFWYDSPIDKWLANHTERQVPFLLTCNEDNPTKRLFDTLSNDVVWQLALSEDASQWRLEKNDNDQVLHIYVGEDSKEAIPYARLREYCGCAHCVDELTGEKKITADAIDPQLSIDSLFVVGHYGQGVVWKEHGTTHSSMYTHDQLTSIMAEVSTGNPSK